MDTSFYTARRGVMATQERLNVISNNIANVNTTAYKAQDSKFSDLMYYNIRATEPEVTRLKAGTGVVQDRTDIDFRPNLIVPTGSKYDYAIKGDIGFFRLQDPQTGEISYTRNGHLSMSQRADGMYLVTDAGKFMLDANGQPLRVVDGDATALPAVYTFENTNGMLAQGSNEYVPIAKNGPAAISPGATVERGYLEDGNVDLADEMAKTVETSRAYSYTLKMVTTSYEVEDTINNLRK